MWWVALAMQAAAGPADPEAARRRAPLVSAKPCDATSTEEVVVCGARDQEAFRLRQLPGRYSAAAGLPRAEVTLAGKLKMAADTEPGQTLGGGAPPRAMVRLKLPF